MMGETGMRRVALVLVAAVAITALAGCSAEKPKTWAQRNEEFHVLGSEVAVTSAPPATTGLSANSIPLEAFASVPGAGDIVVASGTPTVTREQAIEKSRPGTGKLVAAVDVLLPAKVLNAVLVGGPRQTKPRAAWLVTWTDVIQLGRGAPKKAAPAGAKTVDHGDTTVIIDATTGARLHAFEYPTP
jgi:hypothetical protein